MPETTGVIDCFIDVDDVIDGDTLRIELAYSLGHHDIDLGLRCRFFGMDAYEMRDKPRGPQAKQYTREWIQDGWKDIDERPFRVQLVPRNDHEDNPKDRLDRYLIIVWRKLDGRCLNDDLVAYGHGIYKEYD